MNQHRDNAERSFDRLQEQFLRLDSAQRSTAALVEKALTWLPADQRSSRLRPTWSQLDARADELMAEYLRLVEEFDLSQRLTDQRLQLAYSYFYHRANDLAEVADRIESFATTFAKDFERTAARIAETEASRTRATEAVRAAEKAWLESQQQGLTTFDNDKALAQARVALRHVEAWQPDQGAARLTELAELATRLAEESAALSRELPQRVAGLPRRVGALRTRLEAIRNRTSTIEPAMQALRREFSTANWRDLEQSPAAATEALEAAAREVDGLAKAVSAEAWGDALGLVTRCADALQRADDLVDGPADRLAELRALEAEPAKIFAELEFALRDARMLMQQRRLGPDHPARRSLHTLERQVAQDRARLDEAVHPDLWGSRESARKGVAEVHRIVAAVRGTSPTT